MDDTAYVTEYRPARLYRNHGGFTITELLVVIAVIAILAALILSVVGISNERAKSAKDSANLKQIGAALHLYAGENNGIIAARDYSGWVQGPDGTYCRSWASHIHPYLADGERYTGKLEETSPTLRSPFAENEAWNGVSYKANVYLGGYRLGDAQVYSPGGRRLAGAERPSEILIMAPGRCKSKQRLDFDLAGTSPANAGGQLALDSSKGVNTLYLDGHVKYQKPAQMTAQEFKATFYHGLVKNWNPL